MAQMNDMLENEKRIPSAKYRMDIGTIFAIITLFLLNLAANSWVQLKALCLDDLYYWTIYSESKPIEFIFNTCANKFRPVYNFLVFCMYKLFGDNFYLFDIANLLISFSISVVLFFMVIHITKNYVIGFCVSVAFIMSRFAYYQISQVFGIMEALALFLAIAILFYLYRYLNECNNKGCTKLYMIACISYLLVCYTHERYLVLYPLFIIVYLLKEKLRMINAYRVLLVLTPTLIFISTILLRKILFGSHALDGTGGTSIPDNFNLAQTIVFFCSQILYILGINAGPTYLNGIDYTMVPVHIYVLNIIYVICILFVTVLFLRLILNDKDNRSKYIKNSVLFVCFIGACIISSSVTIRVELRWIYVSFVGLLLLFAYMLQTIIYSKKEFVTVNNRTCISICIILTLSFIPIEVFFRNSWKDIHYWPTQSYFNSLYDMTLGRYGDEFWSKKTTIISNGHNIISDDILNSFFEQFAKKKNYNTPDISIATTLSDIENSTQLTNNIILVEDTYNQKYVEITEIVHNNIMPTPSASTLREAKLLDGWYDWEGINKDFIWTKKTSQVKMLTKENGKMAIFANTSEYNLPNTLTIYINDKEVTNIELSDKVLEITVDVPKNEDIDIRMELDHAMSPYDAGVNEDRRILGLCIGDIVMH